MKKISLSHGGGGVQTNELISEIFQNSYCKDLKYEDAAIFYSDSNLAFSTDSYTISPIFFKGGDIGKLSVCGSCNDIAMMGAKPLYLSMSFIIEEGFLFDDLEKICNSIALELEFLRAKVITGDTKIVPKGSVDKIFINSSAIGEVKSKNLSAYNIQDGDVIICSGYVGDHGALIFSLREGIDISSDLQSDCQSLWYAIEALIDSGVKIRAIRDATRGGVAAVLNEWASASDLEIDIDEESIKIRDSVKGICELLGFEAYSLANEGVFLVAVDKDFAKEALEVLKSQKASKCASIIGVVKKSAKSRVLLKSPWGSVRILEQPSGELLPRIC